MKDPVIVRWYMYQIKHPYAKYAVDIALAILFLASLFVLNQPFRVVLATLATFRVAYMVVVEEGPMSVFVRWRTYIYRQYANTWIERGFNCPLCVSFWISWLMGLLLPVANIQDYVLQSLAIAGGCLLLNRIVS